MAFVYENLRNLKGLQLGTGKEVSLKVAPLGGSIDQIDKTHRESSITGRSNVNRGKFPGLRVIQPVPSLDAAFQGIESLFRDG